MCFEAGDSSRGAPGACRVFFARCDVQPVLHDFLALCVASYGGAWSLPADAVEFLNVAFAASGYCPHSVSCSSVRT
jgi:hypothetical protein